MLGTIFLYNFILLGSTFFVYLSEKERTTIGRFLCTTIAFLIVFLPAAFRYQIGVDYYSYTQIYETIGNGFKINIEPAYYYLNYAFNALDLDVEWLFALVAFIIYLPVFISYPKKNRALFHYFYLTTFYFVTFYSLRSMIVTSLAMLAISLYIQNRKIIPYLTLIGVGFLFHKSAILLAPLPFWDRNNIRIFIQKISYLVPIILVALIIFRFELVIYLFESPVSVWLGYDKYAQSAFHIQETEVNTGLGVILRIMPLIFFIFYMRPIIKQNPQYFIWVIIILACIISVILSSTIVIFMRLERLFSMGYIYVPILILSTSKIPKIKKQLILLFLIISGLALYNADFLKSSTQICLGTRISPYVSIFNKEDDHSLKVPAPICIEQGLEK